MADAPKSFPSMPAKSWWVLRERFRRTIPSTIDANYISSALAMTERSAQNNILPPYARRSSPMKIEKLLTDNGRQFTDHFTSKNKTPSGHHAFDRECALLGIEHRLIKPRHPQTNGMVERFNGRISDILATTHFRSHEELQITLERYEKLYNEHLPQRALGHQTPLQAIRTWRKDRPELFARRPKSQAGLDTKSTLAKSLLSPACKYYPICSDSVLSG